MNNSLGWSLQDKLTEWSASNVG